jgi:hypothetical protein
MYYWGSHSVRLVGGLAEMGFDTVNLAKSGWKINDKTVKEIVQKLKQYGAGKDDFIILDPLSNSIFCGTDESGNHIDPIKEDGGWHVTGNLCIRTKPFLKAVLSKTKPILDAVPETKIIFLAPIPRYISALCCSDTGHVTNYSDPEYFGEISGEMERVDDLLESLAQSAPATSLVLNYRAVTDEPEGALPGLSVGGKSIWQEEDPVHADPALYNAIASAITSGIDELGGEIPAAAPKRRRLESVIVRSKNFGSCDTGSTPARPQGWSSGVLPESSRKGSAQGSGRGWPRTRGWPRSRGRMWPGFFGGVRGGRGGRAGRGAGPPGHSRGRY